MYKILLLHRLKVCVSWCSEWVSWDYRIVCYLSDIKFNGHQKIIIFSACNSSDTPSFTTFWWCNYTGQCPHVANGVEVDQRVITKWRQPLRSSKNAKPPKETFDDIVRQDPVPRKRSKRSKHSPTMTVRKDLFRTSAKKAADWNGVRSRAQPMAQVEK